MEFHSILTWNRRKKIGFLILLSSALLSPLILIDQLVVDEAINTDPSTDHTDNQLYINRAEAILEGNILYRDVDTQTPPLINYILIPPVYFGGSPLAFEIYFSLFIVFTVICIYYCLSHNDEKKAFLSALAFLLIPTTLFVPTFARQDEAIVVFFFVLPLLLLFYKGNKYLYTVFSSVGIWIKMHSIFLIPPLVLKSKKRELVNHILIVIAISLVITIPFLILAFKEFIWHIKFYLFGEGGELEGISLWRILDSQGYTIPNAVLISLFIIALLVTYFYSYKKNYGIWKIMCFTLLFYFILYPKIHYEYFLMFFAICIPYFIENRKKIALLFIISLLSGVILLIEQRYLDWEVTSYAHTLFIPLALIFMVLIDILLIILFRGKQKSWLDKSFSTKNIQI